jgi:hypothetical protein
VGGYFQLARLGPAQCVGFLADFTLHFGFRGDDARRAAQKGTDSVRSQNDDLIDF